MTRVDAVEKVMEADSSRSRAPPLQAAQQPRSRESVAPLSFVTQTSRPGHEGQIATRPSDTCTRPTSRPWPQEKVRVNDLSVGAGCSSSRASSSACAEPGPDVESMAAVVQPQRSEHLHGPAVSVALRRVSVRQHGWQRGRHPRNKVVSFMLPRGHRKHINNLVATEDVWWARPSGCRAMSAVLWDCSVGADPNRFRSRSAPTTP